MIILCGVGAFEAASFRATWLCPKTIGTLAPWSCHEDQRGTDLIIFSGKICGTDVETNANRIKSTQSDKSDKSAPTTARHAISPAFTRLLLGQALVAKGHKTPKLDSYFFGQSHESILIHKKYSNSIQLVPCILSTCELLVRSSRNLTSQILPISWVFPLFRPQNSLPFCVYTRPFYPPQNLWDFLGASQNG